MFELKSTPCSECGQSAPAVKFNRNQNTKDGWNYWCNECKRVARPQTICRIHYRPDGAKASYGRFRALCQVRVTPDCATPNAAGVTCKNCLAALGLFKHRGNSAYCRTNSSDLDYTAYSGLDEIQLNFNTYVE